MEIFTKGIVGNSKAIVASQRFTVAPLINRLRQVLDQGDYCSLEASINLPFDEYLLTAIDYLLEKLKNPHLKFVFLVGIGGSNLGAKAIYEALYSDRDLTDHQEPKLICLDTVSEPRLLATRKLITELKSSEEYAVVCISKSGQTTETLMNTEIILADIAEKLTLDLDRLVVISDSGSEFINSAKNLKAHTLAIPPLVGGRYSVFSAVGLVPLALCGINVRDLLAGAEAGVVLATHQDLEQNPVMTSAVLMTDAYLQGKRVFDLFLFHPELESLGKWWRQLTGESLGKKSQNSDLAQVGFIPTVSIGSTDLHSVGQLYLGGQALTFTTFVEVKSSKTVEMPKQRIFGSLVPMINEKKVKQVRTAILSGTKQAFFDRGRPFVEIVLAEITPYELGLFMQTKMIETIYLGNLLSVNPFDQPDVEAYKEVTRTLLEKTN